MDITELYTKEAHETGAEMQVHNDKGEPLEMWITLAGMDSSQWRKAFNSNRLKLIGGDEDANIDAYVDMYADVSIGWRGFMSEGEELKFSKEKIKQLYVNAPYLLNQIDKFITDRGNFTKS